MTLNDKPDFVKKYRGAGISMVPPADHMRPVPVGGSISTLPAINNWIFPSLVVKERDGPLPKSIIQMTLNFVSKGLNPHLQ